MHLNVGLHLVYLVLFIALRKHVFVWIATTTAIKSIKWTSQCCVWASWEKGLYQLQPSFHTVMSFQPLKTATCLAPRPLASGTVWLALRPFVPDLICLPIYACICPINPLPSWPVMSSSLATYFFVCGFSRKRAIEKEFSNGEK